MQTSVALSERPQSYCLDSITPATRARVLTLLAMWIAGAAVLWAQTLAMLPMLVIGWRLAPDRMTYAAGYVVFILAGAFPDLGTGFYQHRGGGGIALHLACYLAVAGWALIMALPGMLARPAPQADLIRRLLRGFTAWLVLPAAIAPLFVLHPVLAAGAYFPGTGVAGFVATALALMVIAAIRLRAALMAVLIGAAAASVAGPTVTETTLVGIEGVSVTQGPPATTLARRAEQLLEMQDGVRAAKGRLAHTVVLPEMVVNDADGSSIAWQAAAARLAANTDVWIGVQRKTAEGFANRLELSSGAQKPVDALVPMPFILWKPWTDRWPWPDGRRWRSTRNGQPLAFLVCYEALTPVAWSDLLMRKPASGQAVVAFVSNQWWAASPRTGSTLLTASSTLARLSGASHVHAVAR